MSKEPDPVSGIPVSAPVSTDSAGAGGKAALKSVVRIVSPQTGLAGTGFLLKNGYIITAEHVARGAAEVVLLPASSESIKALVLALDADLDLALLSPSSEFGATELSIEKKSDLAIGSQVTTWGFPGGYTGRVPILSVGYLAGVDTHRASSGRVLQRWVVNAAFNRGNSGGPLLNVETGGVIGVVSSKLAPISPTTQNALDALANQQSDFTYTARLSDGSTQNLSEGQVVAQVLEELRAQVQLVIGMAVVLDDLRQFVEAQGLVL